MVGALLVLLCFNIGIRCEEFSGRDYVYVSKQMSLNEAEAYCVSTYNQHLATIITQHDMINAVSTLNGSNLAWIGLHSVHKVGWFEYFDNIECPTETKPYGACLGKDFWVEGKPTGCCTECVTLYAHSDDSGQISNDIECETIQPFLCNAPTRKYINSGLTGNWDDAYNYCLNRGGVASFETERDLNNLQKIVQQTNSDYAWIGLVQHSNKQNWYWMDGTKCLLTDDLCTDLWSYGEPNGMPGHVSCECKAYGCIRQGCKQNGCKRSGCKRTGCTNSVCRRECEKYKQSVRCEEGDRDFCCIKWKDICTCTQHGCIDYGCVDYGCIDYGCIENGCTDYQCVTEDADCAAVQSDSGLAADYHCATNVGAIICNDYSTISTGKVETYTSNYLFQDLFEPEHVSNKNILGSSNNYNSVFFFVLLAMSCMINICVCVRCGWSRHTISKDKYESVDVDEMQKN